MTPYIPKTEQDSIDTALITLFTALGELECDNTDTTDQIDNRVTYVITSILNRIYRYSDNDLNTAIGILENTKLSFQLQQIVPRLKQSQFDSEIPE